MIGIEGDYNWCAVVKVNKVDRFNECLTPVYVLRGNSCKLV